MVAKKSPSSTGAEEANDKTRIWEALCKTDPAHTKSFSRSGGFKGTSTKPIWTALRMTEHFGPCGIGWGMEKPEFRTEYGNDEGFVFCTVGLWYVEGDQRGLVYGVGGDKFITKGSSGLRTSDEAFKMSYTDAIGNAMKQIGMCADIHMGLFEDNKYQQEVSQEYAVAKEPKPVPVPESVPEPEHVTAERARLKPLIEAINTAIKGADSLKTLEAISKLQSQTLIDFKNFNEGAFDALMAKITKRQTELNTNSKAA